MIFKILRFSKNLRFSKSVHFSKTCDFQKLAIFKNRVFFNAIKRTIDPSCLSKIMAANTLGEFSDGEDDFVMEIDENLWEWNNSEDDDDLIRNINENEVLAEC